MANKEKLAAIVAKAFLLSEFRDELLRNPEKVGGEYDLTEKEVRKLINGLQAARKNGSVTILTELLGPE